MATAFQPLTDVQTLPPSSCPRCCRRQAQPEAASLSGLAPTISLVPASRPGAFTESSSHADEKTSIAQRRER
ncbi:MAG: hypothetical protein IMW90_21140 [Thermogemmatispora sp.]|jgi:hypothetical protein|uniref:hypothetical protein n=1 Tax=Thermogemmatispora sp. TaxID=1968838 RepID=UPI0019F8A841|nr:hypothetical protein [Thermogemmatispora sp.]MBE3568231.1 hypothetical protein [Thermogemmatispora sp.]